MRFKCARVYIYSGVHLGVGEPKFASAFPIPRSYKNVTHFQSNLLMLSSVRMLTVVMD